MAELDAHKEDAMAASLSALTAIVSLLSHIILVLEERLPRAQAPRADVISTAAAAVPLPPPVTPDELAALIELRPNPPGSKWYLVSAGIEPGIYSSWFEAHPHVNGVTGSSAVGVGTREAALAAYTAAYDSGNIFRR